MTDAIRKLANDSANTTGAVAPGDGAERAPIRKLANDSGDAGRAVAPGDGAERDPIRKLANDSTGDPGPFAPAHVQRVRAGHGANCSSIGSVVDTLFATATVGAALFAAVVAAMEREEVRVVTPRPPDEPRPPEDEDAP